MEKRYRGLRVRKQDDKEVVEFYIRIPEFWKQKKEKSTFFKRLKEFFTAMSPKLSFDVINAGEKGFSDESARYVDWVFFEVAISAIDDHITLSFWNIDTDEIAHMVIEPSEGFAINFQISEDEDGVERYYEVRMRNQMLEIGWEKRNVYEVLNHTLFQNQFLNNSLP